MESISKQEIKMLNDDQHADFLLINVLPQKYFNERHIRTSINVPLENPDFAKIVETVAGSKERKVILYCANIDCDLSPKAAVKLDEAGFTKVYDYEGGAKDWFEGKDREAA